MRIRLTGNGLWVVFGMMLTLAMGSTVWACSGCTGDGGETAPNVAPNHGVPLPGHGGRAGAKSAGLGAGLVVAGYPVVDEPDPIDIPDDDIEPWDEAWENPFGDDDDMMGPMAAATRGCTCGNHVCSPANCVMHQHSCECDGNCVPLFCPAPGCGAVPAHGPRGCGNHRICQGCNCPKCDICTEYNANGRHPVHKKCSSPWPHYECQDHCTRRNLAKLLTTT